MNFKFVLLLCFALIGKSVGQFRCYACGFSSVDSDQSCLTITDETRMVECPSTYCTIFRQEYIDPIGVVASFLRGCEESPDYLNHDIVDSTYRTYYRACTQDLCNIGDGIQSVVGGHLSPTPEYNGLNLLVPGTGSANITTQNIALLSIILSLISIFFV
ncbi:uncharacterized protein ACR2FA_001421 [Aphomia sociella]